MNNYLKNKSVINLDAAMILKENPFYHHCSSIHCSYYSCFQITKFIIISIYNENDDSIYQKRNIANPAKKQSEHDFVIEYVYRKLVDKKELSSAKDFKNNIIKLKALRTNSDYKGIAMEKQQSDEAFNLAEEVIKTLKKHYNYAS